MKLLETVEGLRRWREDARSAGTRVGFVPTMGALHAGHLSLVERARAHSHRVVASVFVNPTQFGPGEDFDRYPRDLEGDLAKLEAAGATAVFHPDAEALYPTESRRVWVEVEELDRDWCGASRPGFFRGVTTVVAKLFNAVQPDVAVFGRKDYQQLVIIRRLVRELLWPIEIVDAPIVREPDGLAMSSRNAYLDEMARRAAPAIYEALVEVSAAFRDGESDAAKLTELLRARLSAIPGAELDYAGLADPETLAPLAMESVARAQCLCAVHLGGARLIDNCDLAAGPEADPRYPATPEAT